LTDGPAIDWHEPRSGATTDTAANHPLVRLPRKHPEEFSLLLLQPFSLCLAQSCHHSGLLAGLLAGHLSGVRILRIRVRADREGLRSARLWSRGRFWGRGGVQVDTRIGNAISG